MENDIDSDMAKRVAELVKVNSGSRARVADKLLLKSDSTITKIMNGTHYPSVRLERDIDKLWKKECK
jgi:hypothetical protein